MLAEAKAIGALVKQGWRPKRTLVYLSWDAEEPMLLGSTEWAEQHADELKQKGLLYINTDGTSRGFLNAEGSHSLQHVDQRDRGGGDRSGNRRFDAGAQAGATGSVGDQSRRQ